MRARCYSAISWHESDWRIPTAGDRALRRAASSGRRRAEQRPRSWHLILRSCRPARVSCRSYICDAMLRTARGHAHSVRFYPIDEVLPTSNRAGARPGELLVVVNYFGVMTQAVSSDRCGDPGRGRDDTQGYFRRGRPTVVVQFGPQVLRRAGRRLLSRAGSGCRACRRAISPMRPSADPARGDDENAWQQFKRHESRSASSRARCRTFPSRLLGAVDWAEGAPPPGDSNFAALHQRLGSMEYDRAAARLHPRATVRCVIRSCPSRSVDRSAASRRPGRLGAGCCGRNYQITESGRV